MAMTLERHDGMVRVKLAGAMTFRDHDLSRGLMSHLRQAHIDGKVAQVRFDLAEVSAMDSYWLAIVVRILRQARAAGARLVVERSQPAIRTLFGMVALDRVLTIVD